MPCKPIRYGQVYQMIKPEADGGYKFRQSEKSPRWEHLWRPDENPPGPVRHLVKDGKPCNEIIYP